jgi:hypothetical protein
MSRQQRSHLHAALLSAFPDEDELGTLMQLEMGVDVDHISVPAPWPHRLAKIISWAEQSDNGTRFSELVTVARAARPQNPELAAYYTRWGDSASKRSALSISLPEDDDQLLRLMFAGIAWFALLALGGFVLARNPSETMLMALMASLLILAAVSLLPLKR